MMTSTRKRLHTILSAYRSATETAAVLACKGTSKGVPVYWLLAANVQPHIGNIAIDAALEACHWKQLLPEWLEPHAGRPEHPYRIATACTNDDTVADALGQLDAKAYANINLLKAIPPDIIDSTHIKTGLRLAYAAMGDKRLRISTNATDTTAQALTAAMNEDEPSALASAIALCIYALDENIMGLLAKAVW